MGNQQRLVKRIEAAERRQQELEAQVQRLSEAAGSALAVEALTELVGREKVGEAMRRLMREKQEAAERAMSERVAQAVADGQIAAADIVGPLSFVVGQRTEGGVSYRVHEAMSRLPQEQRAAWLGRKAGETVEGAGGKTVILEVYDAVPPQAQAVASAASADAPRGPIPEAAPEENARATP